MDLDRGIRSLAHLCKIRPKTQFLWNNLSGPFPRADAVVVVVVFFPSSLALLRGSWTRSPCSKGVAPCLWRGFRICLNMGPCAAEAHLFDGAVRRICLLVFRKQQARLLSLWLTGHIRDLACPLVITIKAGDITAISCQPVKTARWFPWPKGLDMSSGGFLNIR